MDVNRLTKASLKLHFIIKDRYEVRAVGYKSRTFWNHRRNVPQGQTSSENECLELPKCLEITVYPVV